MPQLEYGQPLMSPAEAEAKLAEIMQRPIPSTRWEEPVSGDQQHLPVTELIVAQRDILAAKGNRSFQENEQLKRLDVRIELARRLGELPPEPTIESEVEARLRAEFKDYDPDNVDIPEAMGNRINALAKLSDEQKAVRKDQVAEDFRDNDSLVARGYRMDDNRTGKTGHEIVRLLMEEAVPWVESLGTSPEFPPESKKLLLEALPLDRALLEWCVSISRQDRIYAIRKKQLGI